MNAKTDIFFNELKEAVDSDSLTLPSLPEVALKIRDAVEDENTTTEQIANALSQDGSLSARMIKVVNSPLYRPRTPIDDLHAAVTRLGLTLVRDLVMNLAMKQMFQATSDVLDKKFRSAWSTSVDVAAICQMMSVTMEDISKERALLAGLVHNIGSLPILMLAVNDDDLFNDAAALQSIIVELQGRVGELILTNWNFSDSLVEVVKHCHDFNYTNDDDANLVDLVQVALLQGGFVSEDYVPGDWTQVSAFSKIGMDSEVNVIHIEGNKECIEDAKASLRF
ncbi:MAG: HDOD domain-containing protein [Gammaproteobacteria bacterium]|nr:HDOD domain-containing protein [Gammaproteobacteria bacterium]